MFSIIKSPEAEIDLENIWLYSFKEWGEIQADKYYDELIDGIDQLMENPKIGKPRDYIRLGYRSIQINYHVVYYRLQDVNIDIVRVLHKQMLSTKHLQ